MLLAAAAAWADRHPDTLPPPGFSSGRWVRYRIELGSHGRLLSKAPVDLATPEHKAGLRRVAPELIRPGTKPMALLVCDKVSYVLGPGPQTPPTRVARATKEHAAYLDLLDACIADTHNVALAAVRAFVGKDPYAVLELPQDLKDGDFVEFAVSGTDPLADPAVAHWWATRAAGNSTSSEEGLCLVCGHHRPLVRKFPQLKGIPGAQSSGAPLVSFNKPAHEHYGLKQALNAPTCAASATRSHDALELLIRDERHSRVEADLRWVWWSLGGEDLPLDRLLFETDPAEVAALLASPASGKPTAALKTGRFIAVALAGNSGRSVVRSWIDTALGDAEANIANWFTRQDVVSPDGSPGRPLPLWQLVVAAAPEPGNDHSADPKAARRLLPRLIEAAVLGRPVPPAVLYGVIGRVRATGNVTHAQAAVIKLTTSYPHRQHPEATMTNLVPDRAEPAYQCGRLLAVLGATQRAALGNVNATLIDRYYGSASSSPSTTLPTLIRGAQPHLAKLRRTRPGVARAYEDRLTEIMDRLEHFPRALPLAAQAEFALGYYQQKAADIAAARAAKAAGHAVAPIAEEDIPDTVEDN